MNTRFNAVIFFLIILTGCRGGSNANKKAAEKVEPLSIKDMIDVFQAPSSEKAFEYVKKNQFTASQNGVADTALGKTYEKHYFTREDADLWLITDKDKLEGIAYYPKSAGEQSNIVLTLTSEAGYSLYHSGAREKDHIMTNQNLYQREGYPYVELTDFLNKETKQSNISAIIQREKAKEL